MSEIATTAAPTAVSAPRGTLKFFTHSDSEVFDAKSLTKMLFTY